MTFSNSHQGRSNLSSVRFDALTGFRCLAACMVFVYHNRKYWRNELHPEFLRLINEFNIGVSLFFVLSGFLIAYTYGEKPLQSGKEYCRYLLLRLARIMPVYWLILTCYYLDKSYGHRQFTWLTYSLVHAFSDKHNLDAIAQAWSLNVEMVFYFFAPLLCLLQRKHIMYVLGFLAALFFIAWGTGVYWHSINGNPQHYFYPLQFLLDASFPGRSIEFLAGLLMASAFKKKKAILESIRYKTWIGFAGIFITAYCIGLFEADVYHQGTDKVAGRLIELLLLPVFVVTALTGLIQERTLLQRFFSSRVLVLLGNASFAFYLVHISYVSLKLRDYVLLPDRNFVLLWVISIVLYFLFEKPVYNFLRKKIKPVN
ncbi:acyltransferase family protein [Ferruginibacter albus]|uniref:acyltransferase family protein n=1 Tax=Ferruginibacter albus TaxID=2875540 RepID=UPI001CC5B766|nr:acyltransferase [Ferruginibacter albus]UAY53601.1 acyltransferase [Ferruginibacter albus]